MRECGFFRLRGAICPHCRGVIAIAIQSECEWGYPFALLFEPVEVIFFQIEVLWLWKRIHVIVLELGVDLLAFRLLLLCGGYVGLLDHAGS